MIPLFKVFMAKDVWDFLSPVLHSGYIGEGEKVQLFEKEVGKVIQNDNVVCVNSGTAAITMALRLAGVGHGDTVATTPMTCLATNEPILSLGAKPLWIDVSLDGTMNLSVLYDKIVNKHPKAVLCMDWGGNPCNMDGIKNVCGSIPIIQDSCQSLGSTYNDKPVGNHADYVAFSFQAIKYVTCGDGGALVVNNDKLKEAKLMRWFGLDRTQSKDMRCHQDPPTWGYKFHMNDISASIGLANIRHLDWMLLKTRTHAEIYNNTLNELNKIKIIIPKANRNPNYWLYTLLADDANKFMEYMKANGVACSQVHDRNDGKQMFEQGKDRLLFGVNYFDKHHVCIPVGWWLTRRDVENIVDLIKKYDKEK